MRFFPLCAPSQLPMSYATSHSSYRLLPHWWSCVCTPTHLQIYLLLCFHPHNKRCANLRRSDWPRAFRTALFDIRPPASRFAILVPDVHGVAVGSGVVGY